jgi:predicted PurR-regulated permease PerM
MEQPSVEHESGNVRPREPGQRRGGLVTASQRAIWPLGTIILILVLFRLLPLPLEHAFVIFFTSILLAAAVSPAAKTMARYRVPRGVTILIVYLLGLGILAGAVTLLVPLVASEVSGFQRSLPSYLSRLQILITQHAPQEAGQVSFTSLSGQASSWLSTAARELTSITVTVLKLGIDLVLILVMAFFMAHEENFALLVITRFVPAEGRPRAVRVLSRIGTQLGGWARAQILLAIFFGTVFGLGLWVIGIPYAATLGVVGGILEIVPYVGGFITMVLAVLVALTHDPLHALLALAWYAVVAEVEVHVVHPTLMNRFVRLHPLVVVIALFLGAEALGIIGALLAVPVAIVAQVLLDEFYALPPPPDEDTGSDTTPSDGRKPAKLPAIAWSRRWPIGVRGRGESGEGNGGGKHS